MVITQYAEQNKKQQKKPRQFISIYWISWKNIPSEISLVRQCITIVFK